MLFYAVQILFLTDILKLRVPGQFHTMQMHYASRPLAKSIQMLSNVQVFSYIFSEISLNTNLFRRHKIPAEAIIAS